MILRGREQSRSLATRRLTAPVDLNVSGDELSHQPWPDRSLMISTIAFERTARVSAPILRISWRKATQTVRREQVFLDLRYYSLCAFRRQHAVRKADSEYLIGADGCIRRRSVGDVMKAARFFVPKETVETPTGHRRHVAITLLTWLITKVPRQLF